MEVYLLRHAIAVARGTPQYEGRDGERPLTDDGIKKMKAAAKGMKAIGLSFDRIVTSPLVRARHTAEIVAGALGEKKRLEQSDALGEAFSCDAAVELLSTFDENEKVLLVGHEPDFGELADFLLNGRFGMKILFKKGGLMRLDFDGKAAAGEATLVWHMQPSHLRAFE